MDGQDEKSRRNPQIMFLVTVTVLAAVTGVACLAHLVAALGPSVGDIIAFDPVRTGALDSQTRLPAKRPGRAGCVLDVGIIQRSGGSLVVEQRGAGEDRLYRAHWAGHRTSEDGTDCGSDTDVMLSGGDIGILAIAAGGLGLYPGPILFQR